MSLENGQVQGTPGSELAQDSDKLCLVVEQLTQCMCVDTVSGHCSICNSFICNV
jgi:hypothetical protein